MSLCSQQRVGHYMVYTPIDSAMVNVIIVCTANPKMVAILDLGFAILLPDEPNNGKEKFAVDSNIQTIQINILSDYLAMAGIDESAYVMIDFFAKKAESENKSDSCDRISYLPDEILIYILSLMPTLFAISTSTLSKRWRNLWTNARNIDFDDSLLSCSLSLNKPRSFSKFGNNVFRLNRVDPLNKFRLSCLEQNCGEPTFCNWISAAAKRNPEEINICIQVGNPFAFPANIFTCEKLVVLKLSAMFIINLPNMVHFPNLKSLRLSLLRFSVDNPMEKILSGCPLLEDLYIGQVSFDKLTKLAFICPSLKRLRVTLSNVRDQYVVIMDTPYLKDLYINVPSLKGIETTQMPLLREAYINVSPKVRTPALAEEFASGLMKLLYDISGVNILTISWNADAYIREVFHHMLLPIFGQLTHLEVKIFGSWQLMTHLLEFTPNLNVIQCVNVVSTGKNVDRLLPQLVFGIHQLKYQCAYQVLR